MEWLLSINNQMVSESEAGWAFAGCASTKKRLHRRTRTRTKKTRQPIARRRQPRHHRFLRFSDERSQSGVFILSSSLQKELESAAIISLNQVSHPSQQTSLVSIQEFLENVSVILNFWDKMQ
jgi:hypothetical protein